MDIPADWKDRNRVEVEKLLSRLDLEQASAAPSQQQSPSKMLRELLEERLRRILGLPAAEKAALAKPPQEKPRAFKFASLPQQRKEPVEPEPPPAGQAPRPSAPMDDAFALMKEFIERQGS